MQIYWIHTFPAKNTDASTMAGKFEDTGYALMFVQKLLEHGHGRVLIDVRESW